jgi:hypothetical protein
VVFHRNHSEIARIRLKIAQIWPEFALNCINLPQNHSKTLKITQNHLIITPKPLKITQNYSKSPQNHSKSLKITQNHLKNTQNHLKTPPKQPFIPVNVTHWLGISTSRTVLLGSNLAIRVLGGGDWGGRTAVDASVEVRGGLAVAAAAVDGAWQWLVAVGVVG